ncbi:MAG: hypothetical protein AAF149_17675 [Bacteroidota bacterium]
MKQKNAIILISRCSLGCKPRLHNPVSYPSPDGKMILDVISEDQASNDPDSFWQHFSLRNSKIKSPAVPGNILFIPASKQSKTSWKSNDFVWIEFNGNYGPLFGKKEANSKFVDKIFVEVVINHYSSDNQKALINFSTRAF